MSSERRDDANGPWSDLTEELLGLTERIRSGYRKVADESGPSEAEVRQALRTLSEAWNQISGSVGEVIQDPEVRSHLRRSASHLADAVGATLAEFTASRPDPVTEDGEEE